MSEREPWLPAGLLSVRFISPNDDDDFFFSSSRCLILLFSKRASQPLTAAAKKKKKEFVFKIKKWVKKMINSNAISKEEEANRRSVSLPLPPYVQ